MACRCKGAAMRKFLPAAVTLVLFCMALVFAACAITQTGETTVTFSHSGKKPADGMGRESLYIEDGVERLTLSCALSLPDGEAVIEVINLNTNASLWREVFTTDAAFTIPLKNLQAGYSYDFVVHITQATEYTLQLTY